MMNLRRLILGATSLILIVGSAVPAAQSEAPLQRARLPVDERHALEALYKATNGNGWTDHGGWLGRPGTECDWHGVRCVPKGDTAHIFQLDLDENNLVGQIPSALGQLGKLQSLDLSRNRLTGSVPVELGQLKDLEWLSLYGNHLSGLLPQHLIDRWLAGPLAIYAEAHLLSDVSEIDFESSSSSVLCATHRIIFRADESALFYTERCRNASPNDRTTFCEVKRGHVNGADFATLGWLIERNGFFDLNTRYFRGITEATFENTRVTKNAKTHAVSNYAAAGPFELWVIEAAIEGVAASVEWGQTTTQRKCPSW